ncbi:glycosyltransferase family 2 protein [Flavihumibacter fluvii]|nr:glycosyltransferase family A protein [Flavihumibacter fluvii]ULQ53780.1 glycosyltransferase family 2 protein [Flavihumibacter fluvii]
MYIQDALDSVSLCTYPNIEIIIVNDGSTDRETNEILAALKKSGIKVIFQQNMGLGGARNTGIHHSAGKYILPLDGDNKIRANYISLAVQHLEENENTAVVYGNAEKFGAEKGFLKPGAFNLQRLMLGNFIDACAIVRKSVLIKIGLYDNMKIMGYEDWDLWLRIAFKGYDFHHIDEVMFDYRVIKDSMMRSLNADISKQNEIEIYFAKKYADKLDFEYVENRIVYQLKKNPLSNAYRIAIKNFFPRHFEKLVQKNKIYKYILYDRK